MGAIFGQTVTLAQEKGPEIELVVFGDEFYARYETIAGYTVVRDDARGTFCYAELLGGEFVSTGVPATEKPPTGVRRHLKESSEVRGERFEQGQRSRGFPRPRRGERTLGPCKGLLYGRRVSSGKIRGLAIIVEFQDVAAAVTSAEVAAMLNDPGYARHGNHGSVRDYFLTMSSGTLDFTNDVVGPIKLSKDRQYYTKTLLVEEALRAAVQQGVDLKCYDSRSEGMIDALSFLYAGDTQYVGELWPHNHVVNITIDGVQTNFYQITALGRSAARLVIGTFCHEAGHMLCRWPDLYDYGSRDGDFEKSAGLGTYCLMSAGNHLDDGRTPAAVCAYLRDLVEWCPKVVDLQTHGRYEAKHGTYDTVYRHKTARTNEYFLVENRVRVGYDRHLPASGLAVFHCDILGSNEWGVGTADRHAQCGLLQADGHRDLETSLQMGDEGDLFGTKDGVALSHVTKPSSNQWDGTESGMLLSNVLVQGDVIAFVSGEHASGGEIHEEAYPDRAIPDADGGGIAHTISITRAGQIADLAVTLDIVHSYIGDLRVELVGPEGHRAVLCDREGMDAHDLKVTLTAANAPALAVFAGRQANGPWVLRVSDLEAGDVGKLARWALAMRLDPSAGSPRTIRGGLVEDPEHPAKARSRRQASPRERGLADEPEVFEVTVAEAGLVRDVRVRVDVAGVPDKLTVGLTAPTGQRVVLHDRKGGAGTRISAVYTPLSTPGLSIFSGADALGVWALDVAGEGATMCDFSLEIVTDG